VQFFKNLHELQIFPLCKIYNLEYISPKEKWSENSSEVYAVKCLTNCLYISIVYPPPLFHMESMWNVNIPWNFHGIPMESMWNMLVPSEYLHGIHMECIYSMDSIWNIFHYINKVFIHMDSTWIPHGMNIESFHVDSMWIPCGFHMEWGDLVEFGNLKKMYSLILQTQLTAEMVGGQRCENKIILKKY